MRKSVEPNVHVEPTSTATDIDTPNTPPSVRIGQRSKCRVVITRDWRVNRLRSKRPLKRLR